MAAYVLLPHSLALSVGLVDLSTGQTVAQAVVTCQQSPGQTQVTPGLHSANGSFTEVERLVWQDNQLNIKSGHADNSDQLVLEIHVVNAKPSVAVMITPSYLWGQGMGNVHVDRRSGQMVATASGSNLSPVKIFATQSPSLVWQNTMIFQLASGSSLGISSNVYRPLTEIQSRLDQRKKELQVVIDSYGPEWSEVYKALYTVVAWNIVYDPRQGVFIPFSRRWAFGNDVDYAFAEWDCYFGSWMATLIHPEIAILSLYSITYTQTTIGFVPNYASGLIKSRDRSEPPVGSLATWWMYKHFTQKYPNKNFKWVLQLLWDKLYTWNTWWWEHRKEASLLTWGSDPNPPENQDIEYVNLQAARYESGLDNSPMYDSPPVVFNQNSFHMMLWDVGLNSLYISDCEWLQHIASELGPLFVDPTASQILHYRRANLTDAMNTHLWNDDLQIYTNRLLGSSSGFYPRLSPTLFYPMLANVANSTQVEAMLVRHMMNPNEFCVAQPQCPFAMPSIARNDPAFPDNNYWRGRIWGPMNMLAYLGLRRYRGLPPADRAIQGLVQQAKKLLLGQWLPYHHVHENYNAVNGEGCDKSNSDPFYHWGALNGFIGLMEAGFIVGPDSLSS